MFTVEKGDAGVKWAMVVEASWPNRSDPFRVMDVVEFPIVGRQREVRFRT